MNIIEVKPNVFAGDSPEAASNVGFVRTAEGVSLP